MPTGLWIELKSAERRLAEWTAAEGGKKVKVSASLGRLAPWEKVHRPAARLASLIALGVILESWRYGEDSDQLSTEKFTGLSLFLPTALTS
jgi:hypothetical protein